MMIHTHSKYRICIILGSLLIAIILQIIPCPLKLFNLPQPSWLNLLLIYWTIQIPNKINIGTGFTNGLITDIILGPIIGIRAITLSIITYLLIIKFPVLYETSLYKKGIVVTFIFLIIHTVIYLSNIFLIKKILFSHEILINKIFLSSVVDGITWIGIYLIMYKIFDLNKTKKSKNIYKN